jgi:SpoIID/LytB domain protein/LPXTG-motif cell wall-anchored protein
MSARRLAALVVAVAAAATLPVVPAMGQPSRLRVSAPPGESLLVRGEYPPVESSCVDPEQPVLHARYRGTIEIVRRDDGSLSLIGEVGFEEYVKGIAEVPRDWPMEALKAQVVAARTYALNRLQSADPGGDYDLCATTSCQVYAGMRVEAGPWGDRWIRAVDQTAGQVLLYEGRPASTFYSSTSPGRTFDVEDVFGGEPLPYLRAQDETDDGASPLSHWRVDVPFEDLARFLAADGLWPGGPIRRVSAAEGRIRVAGDRGVTLSKGSLRDALNEWAECLAPDRYPTSEPDGYQLPQAVPSIWYRAEQDGEALVLAGRGWGHGIGMVQWGAYGKAKRGSSYADILAAYYGGLRPEPVDLPGTIRILIAEGLRLVTVEPSAGAGTNPTVGPAPPWTVGGAGRLRIRRGRPPPPVLRLTEIRLPSRAVAGQPYPVRLSASDDVEVRLEFLSGGRVLGHTGSRPVEEGSSRLRVPAPTLPSGVYEVRLTATDGVDTVVGVNESVRLGAPSTAVPTPPTDVEAAERPEPPTGDADAGQAVWIGAALALALLALLLLTARRRKGLHRG